MKKSLNATHDAISKAIDGETRDATYLATRDAADADTRYSTYSTLYSLGFDNLIRDAMSVAMRAATVPLEDDL
jgi:hypothetical protein